MKKDYPSSIKHTGNDWREVGILEPSIGNWDRDEIEEWLHIILESFNLPEDFLGKIVISANQAVERVLEGTDRLNDCQHVHLLVFAPERRTSSGKTWGFFRIEKEEFPTEDRKTSDHKIEIYLYLESQSGKNG